MIRNILLGIILLAASPVLAQPESPSGHVEVNGMSMYYEISGQGDPLVVLHGAHMNIVSMGEIIPKLAANHTVYALEFQVHGRTTDIDRPITYENLADDAAAFMDAFELEKADVFGYSMGAAVGLQLAIRHREKVDKLVAASTSYSVEGFQPAYKALIPQMGPEMFAPFKESWQVMAPDSDGFDAFIEKMIALEHEDIDWEDGAKSIRSPVLLITGDADVTTREHSVELFRLLGGGVMGDMGEPLPASRLAVLPATSHTAIITQTDLLMAFVQPFLAGETPKGMFD